MPLTAGSDGGSGSRSSTENRNASGQLVNALIFEGVRVLGRASGEAGSGEVAMETIACKATPGVCQRPG